MILVTQRSLRLGSRRGLLVGVISAFNVYNRLSSGPAKIEEGKVKKFFEEVVKLFRYVEEMSVYGLTHEAYKVELDWILKKLRRGNGLQDIMSQEYQVIRTYAEDIEKEIQENELMVIDQKDLGQEVLNREAVSAVEPSEVFSKSFCIKNPVTAPKKLEKTPTKEANHIKARKSKAQEYSAASMHELTSGLCRYLRPNQDSTLRDDI